METRKLQTDLCIVGGGLAGSIAALSAARHGVKVVLIQDRPMLGGNASSEIRMQVRGAEGKYNRETGILNELEEENIYRNDRMVPEVWDSVLFGKVKQEENITLLLNCSCFDAKAENGRLISVRAWQLTTYITYEVTAKYFADCSGDSILAPLSGAKYRIGREANDEYGETIGPKIADAKTMGMSVILQARETDHKVEFIPPVWANKYETDEDFAVIPDIDGKNAAFRDHEMRSTGTNFWWMELGGEGPAIENTEETRDELMKVLFGIWDHVKNYGDHGADNWELEWIGFLPGKRESVRYVGEHVLTQTDVEQGGKFEDIIAYGGWPMDDHDPRGMKANSVDAAATIMHPAPSPYGIPYRSLYSVNVENLFFAGRNISATHAANSSARVMATCSLLGQAMGTAAAICIRKGLLPKEIKGDSVKLLQKILMDDGVFLPGLKREMSALTQSAKLNLSDAEKAVLQNGMERPRKEGDVNYLSLPVGESLTFTFEDSVYIDTLRILFDLEYDRTSVSDNPKLRRFAIRFHHGKDFKPVRIPETVVKRFTVFADGVPVYSNDNNYETLIKVPIQREAKEISVRFDETRGADAVHLYACDFVDSDSIGKGA